ncbi:hypothetical protein ACWD1Y_41855 [Streptomyces sp. NPDC002814]
MPEGQGELFTAWRCHAAFTDTACRWRTPSVITGATPSWNR